MHSNDSFFSAKNAHEELEYQSFTFYKERFENRQSNIYSEIEHDAQYTVTCIADVFIDIMRKHYLQDIYDIIQEMQKSRYMDIDDIIFVMNNCYAKYLILLQSAFYKYAYYSDNMLCDTSIDYQVMIAKNSMIASMINIIDNYLIEKLKFCYAFPNAFNVVSDIPYQENICIFISILNDILCSVNVVMQIHNKLRCAIDIFCAESCENIHKAEHIATSMQPIRQRLRYVIKEGMKMIKKFSVQRYSFVKNIKNASRAFIEHEISFLWMVMLIAQTIFTIAVPLALNIDILIASSVGLVGIYLYHVYDDIKNTIALCSIEHNIYRYINDMYDEYDEIHDNYMHHALMDCQNTNTYHALLNYLSSIDIDTCLLMKKSY